MANVAVLRFEKHKTTSSINSIAKHNERNYKNSGPANVDSSMSHLNETIVAYSMPTLAEAVDAHIAATVTGRKKKDAVRMLEGIMTVRREFFLDENGKLDVGKMQAWRDASMQFIYDTFGREHVMSAILHVDETSPHIHVCIVPVTKDGRLSCRDFLGGKQKCSQMQDRYHAAVAHLGLERGLLGSIAKHKTLKEHYAAVTAAWRGDSLSVDKLPPPRPEKRFFGGKRELDEYRDACCDYVERVRGIVHEIAARSDSLHDERLARKRAERRAAEERTRRLKAEDQAAQYKLMYEQLKAQIDTKRLRALSIASIAALLGYEKTQDGRYKLGQHFVHISEKSYEFQHVGAYGRNVIDFMCEHLRLTERRPEVTPAEAIVRLAALVHDDETLRETALAGLADRAEEWLDGLKGQIDYARARQEHQPPREPAEPLESQQSPQVPLESQQGPPLEHQPGRLGMSPC